MDIDFSNQSKLFLIAGPCVIESRQQALTVAEKLTKISQQLDIDVIYKSSFDKANRTSIQSYRGPGMEDGLKILDLVKQNYGLPLLTDIHTPSQAKPVSDVVDVLQIPAFLSRQTDMLVEAGKTGLPVHVKKGQFLAAEGMKHVADKIASTGNQQILLCERGAMYGYNNLVVDMRNLDIMKDIGYPVVFDATHSVQRPGSRGTASGGDRHFAPTLARAAIAVGVGGVFAEVHPDPEKAKSDSATQLPLSDFGMLVKRWKEIDKLVRQT